MEKKLENEAKLMKINEAYEYLSDHEKRLTYKAERANQVNYSELITKTSPELQNLLNQVNRIWNSIQLNDRNTFILALKEYFTNKDAVNKDISLLFHYNGVFKGAFRAGAIMFSLTGIFAVIGVLTSLLSVGKFSIEVVRSTLNMMIFPLRLLFGRRNPQF